VLPKSRPSTTRPARVISRPASSFKVSFAGSPCEYGLRASDSEKHVAQPGFEVSDYDFTSLSAFDFEMLVKSLLDKEWACSLEAFKSGRDGGIDLRYAPAALNGSNVVVQCKHFAQSGLSKLLSHLRKDELPKIQVLAPSRYVLATSVGLTPANKDELRSTLYPFVRTTGDIIGQTEINHLLSKYPEVEQAHFKLWLTSKAVLDRVLHNAELCHAEFTIERIVRKLPVYVQNASYPRALSILKENNVVIISGEPGVGKTTLAEMIVYSYVSDGYSPVVIQNDLREGKALFTKGAPQIFYFDDFLGQTFLRERTGFLLRNEDAAIVDFIDMVRHSTNAKLVMTTREHILSNAFLGSDRLRRSALVDFKCVLEIADYSRTERARILYNHIYFSDLPREYRAELIKASFYEEVLCHANFNPRLVEWLSSYRRVKSIPVDEYQSFVIGLLDDPQEIWREAYDRQISSSARTLLLALFSAGGEEHITTFERVWRAMDLAFAPRYNLSASIEPFNQVLKELEGSFIIIQNGTIAFINPSMKDFLGNVLLTNLDQIPALIEGAAKFDQLVRMWQWAGQKGGSSARKIIQDGEVALALSADRTLSAPCRELLSSGSASAERPLDIYPEARLRNLIAMAEQTRSLRLAAQIPAAYEAVLTEWAGHYADFEECIGALEALESSPWVSAEIEPSIYTTLRRRMFEELAHSTTFKDFGQVDDFSYRTKISSTAEEHTTYSSALNIYLKESFADDLGDVGGDTLDAMATFLEKVTNEYGFSTDRQLSDVLEAITQRNEEAEYRADQQSDRWREARAFERADHEAIASMFDSLK
jgi:hypothetical protein